MEQERIMALDFEIYANIYKRIVKIFRAIDLPKDAKILDAVRNWKISFIWLNEGYDILGVDISDPTPASTLFSPRLSWFIPMDFLSILLILNLFLQSYFIHRFYHPPPKEYKKKDSEWIELHERFMLNRLNRKNFL